MSDPRPDRASAPNVTSPAGPPGRRRSPWYAIVGGLLLAMIVVFAVLVALTRMKCPPDPVPAAQPVPADLGKAMDKAKADASAARSPN